MGTTDHSPTPPKQSQPSGKRRPPFVAKRASPAPDILVGRGTSMAAMKGSEVRGLVLVHGRLEGDVWLRGRRACVRVVGPDGVFVGSVRDVRSRGDVDVRNRDWDHDSDEVGPQLVLDGGTLRGTAHVACAVLRGTARLDGDLVCDSLRVDFSTVQLSSASMDVRPGAIAQLAVDARAARHAAAHCGEVKFVAITEELTKARDASRLQQLLPQTPPQAVARAAANGLSVEEWALHTVQAHWRGASLRRQSGTHAAASGAARTRRLSDGSSRTSARGAAMMLQAALRGKRARASWREQVAATRAQRRASHGEPSALLLQQHIRGNHTRRMMRGAGDVALVRALYDYDGPTDDDAADEGNDELTFDQGDMIKCDAKKLNDAERTEGGLWITGEHTLDGAKGVFPSSYVERVVLPSNAKKPQQPAVEGEAPQRGAPRREGAATAALFNE